MSIDRHRRHLGIVSMASIAAVVCACRGPANEGRQTVAERAASESGLVSPLKNDTSDQIVPWVDGQVVTDWAAEVAKRQRAIDGYLDDTDPARAEKYGFRSGQNPQLAWHWFRNNPVGFNGVPFVLFKTILDLDPDHENPTLRTIARIWKREAVVPSTAGTAATGWTLIISASEPTRLTTSTVSFGRPIYASPRFHSALRSRTPAHSNRCPRSKRPPSTGACSRVASFRTRPC